jgi:hypothetical protein
MEAATAQVRRCTREKGSSEYVALKQGLSALVAEALETRRRHDRELQQMSRQLLHRPDAMPTGGSSRVQWAELMARVDFMPVELRTLAERQVKPHIAANDFRQARAEVAAVEAQYLQRIWKQSQQAEEAVAADALTLLSGVVEQHHTAKKQRHQQQQALATAGRHVAPVGATC